MGTFSRQQAMNTAKGNAAYFQCSYFVFADTSGNWRCERGRPKQTNTTEVRPDGTTEEHKPDELIDN